jgi:Zn-dependent protease with chaperone function
MELKPHKSENALFAAKVVFTILLTILAAFLVSLALENARGTPFIATLVTFTIYCLFFALFLWFQKIYLVAYLKGNGICVSPEQFPEVDAIYGRMCGDLDMRKAPKLFVLQQGGLLNAFAVRFSGANYIAVYSDIFELMSDDIDVLKFVLGHELGHVKRNHMSKRFWTFPSSMVPFLTSAYSRSCEYSCDNIGGALTGAPSIEGLVLLAAGKGLYKKVNIESYLREAAANKSAAVRFMGLFMSHPYLPSRIANLRAGA